MFEPTRNIEYVEPTKIVEEVSTIAEEVRVFPIAIGEGTSKAAEEVGVESIVVIL